jgi:hypothetical protein
MRKLICVILAFISLAASGSPPPELIVEWDFDSRCLDILQFFNEAQHRWDPVPGPYEVVAGKYKIPVPADQPFRMFRVVRDWGVPYIVRPDVWPY